MNYLKWTMLCMAVVFTACTSPKKVVYFQDAASFSRQEIEQKYEAKIHADDLLSIVVNSKDPELALPFNLPRVNYQLGVATTTGGQQNSLLGYLVDTDGNIDFPFLGTLHVEGLTRAGLTGLIKKVLEEKCLLKDPIVIVQFLNFKVSVMGEVANPGCFTVSGDRITLLEALSMAGDLTIYGKRDRVAVIREDNGVRTIMYQDLRSADIFNSPAYYLQQNDIVYVEPNKAKSGQSGINQNNSVGVWLSVVSVLSSLVSLAVTLATK